MDPSSLAGYVFVLVGAVAALAGVRAALNRSAKPPDQRGTGLFWSSDVVLLGAGLVFIGLGAWGPRFLKDASSFFEDLAAIATGGRAGDEAADELIDAIAADQVDGKYLSVARAVLLSHPPPDMTRKLAEAAERTKDPAPRKFLLGMSREYEMLLDRELRAFPGSDSSSDHDKELNRMNVSRLRLLRTAPEDRLQDLGLSRDRIDSSLKLRGER